MGTKKSKKFCFTIDLEEVNIPLKENDIFDLPEIGTKKVLNVMKKYNIKGTFFVTGIMATKKENLMHRIVEEGHELASHSFRHDVDIRNNLNEIHNSRKILEKFSNINGFRAPFGRINENVLREIEKHFVYDSSILPTIIPGYYNNLRYPTKPFKINSMWEVPISCTKIFRIPIGWWWFKNFGLNWTIFFSKFCEQPIVFNIHTTDVIEIPYRYKKFQYYKSSSKVIDSLEKLLLIFKKTHHFLTIKEYLDDQHNLSDVQ